MAFEIRKVQPGDESALAYIQTESWKAAFASILDAETLARCTQRDRTEDMYRGLLEKCVDNGYLLSVDGQPHCIAWWSDARDAQFAGKAELICIHSLPGHWREGYGSAMMDRVLHDIHDAGYAETVLWVFADNHRARAFYEAKGFRQTAYSQPAFGSTEVCYSRTF